MIENNKTRLQLLHELTELRKRCAALEVITGTRNKLEEDIKDVRDYADGIVKTVRTPLLVMDSDLRILFANRGFYNTFKADPKNTVGNFIYDLGDRQWDIPELRVFLKEILPKATELNDYEVEHDFPNVGQKIIQLNAREIIQKSIGSRIILLSMEDITERRRLEAEVRQLAFYDELTKLPNRRLFNDRLGLAMAASQRSGRHCALIFLDLDDFKLLNDMHGHVVGDLLLLEVANRLKKCIREMDTVARLGGDEFVVILNELNADKAESTSQARVVAEKIRRALSGSYSLVARHEGSDRAIEYNGSASVGYILFFNHEASRDEILKLADKAMYQDKKSRRQSIKH